MPQRMTLIQSPFFLTEPQLKDKNWDAIFGRNAPLALEIGCGVGDFIVQEAARRPEINFIAIDIYNQGCLKAIKRIEKSGLKNIRLMRTEARYLLQQFVAQNGLCAVYINCPDPWPKKRHRKRRLVNHELLRQMLYYLQPGGDFYFATDFADYGESVGELFEATEGYTNQQTTPFSHDLPGYPISKYMRRFLEMGQPIYFVQYRKELDLIADKSFLPDYRQGFRLPWGASRPHHKNDASETPPSAADPE